MKASEPFPIVYVKDVAKSEQFYCDAFGFEAVYRFPADGPSDFVYLQLEPSGIGLGASDGENVHGRPVAPGAGSFELFLYVDDMDEACARLCALGAPELRPPVDEPWGERRAYFEDPDGNAIHRYFAHGEHGPPARPADRDGHRTLRDRAHRDHRPGCR